METSSIECWPLEPTKTHQTKKCKYQTKKLKTRHSIGMTPKKMEAPTKRLDPGNSCFFFVFVLFDHSLNIYILTVGFFLTDVQVSETDAVLVCCLTRKLSIR